MTEYAPAISSFVGILIGSGLVAVWLKGRQAKVAELSRDITDLRDREVKVISRKLDHHIGTDRSQEFAAKIETVISQNNEILLEQKKLNRESAAQGQTMNRNEKSVNNLWDKFDGHRQDRDLHHA